MAVLDRRKPALPTTPKVEFSAAEIGALAHLYRGEVYRSTVWRTRLDSTTNWAVVTTGIALSATFSSAEASPLPMVLVGLIVTVFLMFEVRRYRYFNVWRARARLLESDFYAPMIRGEGIHLGAGWTRAHLGMAITWKRVSHFGANAWRPARSDLRVRASGANHGSRWLLSFRWKQRRHILRSRAANRCSAGQRLSVEADW